MSEQRFHHLLQPIRELANNWNIDIARDLEDYLEELESVTIRFEEGAADFNFAEAALVIQGSACIYSKKVEHLHALVYRTLEHLCTQKNKKDDDTLEDEEESGVSQSVKKKGAKRAKKDVEGIEEEGTILPYVRSIRMSPSISMTEVATAKKYDGTGKDSERDNGMNYQASIALMGSLIPDELDSGDAFKLMSCEIHHTGALLIEASCSQLLQRKTLEEASRDAIMQTVQSTEAQTAQELVEFGEAGADDDDNSYRADGEEDEDDDNDNDTGFDVGMDIGDDLVGTPIRGEQEIYDHRKEGDETGNRILPQEPVVSIWEPLDPHSTPNASEFKPFQKGKTYRSKVAKCDRTVILGAQDERKFASKSISFATVPFLSPHLLPFHETLHRIPINKCLFSGTLHVRSMHERERMLQNAAQRKLCEGVSRTGVTTSTTPGTTGRPSRSRTPDSGHSFFQNADDDDSEEEEDNEEEDDPGIRRNTESSTWGMKKSLKDEFERGLSGRLTYEELCQSHVVEFMRGADEYIQENSLTRQIDSWQKRLQPILQRQERLPAFDIQECSKEIVVSLQEKDPSPGMEETSYPSIALDEECNPETQSHVPFTKLVEGRKSYEICRIFLASLQLANNGNVELFHAKSAEEQQSTPFRMQLLSTKDCYEAIH